MTFKKFKKRVFAILNDERSYFLEGEELKAWKQKQKEISKSQAEIEFKENEIIEHWFEQDTYVHGSWFKRLMLRIQYLLRNTHAEGHLPQIPDHIRMEIARCILPEIIAYYESEQGRKEFEEWKTKQSTKNQEDNKIS
jgi:hypothetical protein